MMHTIINRVGFLTLLAAMVFVFTPLVAFSGGPEPGPDGDDLKYVYNPPPYSGDATLRLDLLPGGGSVAVVLESGTLWQLGNSDCQIVATPANTVGFAPELPLISVPTCDELHPNDLMGFWAEVTTVGCGNIDIETIAAAKLICIESDPITGRPVRATAKLIVMEYVQK